MPLKPFKLERYFAEYEFKVQYLLSPSDCESLSLEEVLGMADEEDLRLWEGLRLGYTESQGHPLLREEVSRLYQSISPQEVMIAVPEEAIYIAMHTLLEPGDHAIVLYPAYQSLYEVARAIGCEVSLWPVQPGEGGWQLDLDELEKSLRENTRLLVVNFPHNPTGYLPTLEVFEAILEIAKRSNLYLFSDEMYRLLEYDPGRRLPPACDRYERAVTLSGLSKTFALPGLRLGWLATHERELLERFLAFKDYTTICHSAPSEVLGILALRAKEAIVARSLGIVHENLEHAEAFFGRHNDRFRWIPPQAGSVAFPEWLGEGPVEALCQGTLEQEGLMIVPGTIFDFSGNHFRVGLGRLNFPQALARLEHYLQG